VTWQTSNSRNLVEDQLASRRNGRDHTAVLFLRAACPEFAWPFAVLSKQTTVAGWLHRPSRPPAYRALLFAPSPSRNRNWLIAAARRRLALPSNNRRPRCDSGKRFENFVHDHRGLGFGRFIHEKELFFGAPTRARPIASICCSPPEKRLAELRRRSRRREIDPNTRSSCRRCSPPDRHLLNSPR